MKDDLLGKIIEAQRAVARNAIKDLKDSELWREMNEAQHRFYAEQEAYIRSEIRRLRTHRLNVEIVTTGPQWSLDGMKATLHQDIGVRLLLPRGPRPLP